MKKKMVFILIVLAVLLLIGFRYAVVEREDILPDDVRTSFQRFFGIAAAETDAPAETPAPTETPAPSETPAPTPIPTPQPRLERGDSGDEVKALQERLRELGFMTGAADGKFGPKTEEAVKAFKRHMYRLEQERIEEERLEQERLAAEAAAENASGADVAPAETDASGADVAPAETGESTTEATPAETDASGAEVTPAATDANGAEAVPAETGASGAEAMPSETDASDADVAPAETDENVEEIIPAETDEEPIEPEFDGKVDEETYRLIVENGFDEYQKKLARGARGVEVERMQMRLKTLGYLTGKADGIFGGGTANAVISFQKSHKLAQDGIAGEKTQRALYDSSAKKYVKPVQKTQVKGKPYLLKVSTAKQRVYAYAWNEADKGYTSLVRTMVCSTGLADTPTPKGTFTSTTTPVVRWGYFPKYDVWAQYLYRIKGPYLFHSVLYDEADESTVKWGSVNKLGSPASHGCIRLSVEDARWIYNNCPAGTTVTIT